MFKITISKFKIVVPKQTKNQIKIRELKIKIPIFKKVQFPKLQFPNVKSKFPN